MFQKFDKYVKKVQGAMHIEVSWAMNLIIIWSYTMTFWTSFNISYQKILHSIWYAKNVIANRIRTMIVYTQLEPELKSQWCRKNGELYNHWSINYLLNGISQLPNFFCIRIIFFIYFLLRKLDILGKKRCGSLANVFLIDLSWGLRLARSVEQI